MRRDVPFAQYFRQEYPVLIAMIGLFILLSVLSILFLVGGKRRDTLLIKYEVERTASALFESYQGGGETPGTDLGKITGYGFYNYSGDLLGYRGEVPDRVDIPAQGSPATGYSYDRGENTVTLVRRIGLPEFLAPFEAFLPRRPNTPVLICVKIGAGSLFRRQKIYEIGYVVAPVVIAGLVAMAAWFHFRNWTFRSRLAAQKHLVRMGEIARTLSHEIKNPLSAIQIQTGLLRRLLPAERLPDIGVIEEEVDRLRTLVERIGEFLRNPTGTLESVNVDEFIRELLARYDWDVKYSSGVSAAPMVRIDPGRFRSVMENLVKNAIESGNGSEPVEISLRKYRNWIRVSVLDYGEGLPAGDVERLFDPFFTTKDAGSGIGLAVTRRFVEAAGGRLALIPRSPKGTEARVELPEGRT